MRTWNRSVVVGLIFIILLTGCTSIGEDEEVKESANEVIELLKEEKYDAIYSNWFSPSLQEKLTTKELAREWERKTIDITGVDVTELEIESRTDNVAVVEATFETNRSQFELRVIFNNEKQLVGFHLTDERMLIEQPQAIIEEAIIIGEKTDYELDGILSLPKNIVGEIPAVILVHGSGPSDKDETAFAYKPFRDIAYGLAEQGIAVIRYNKRTFQYLDEMRELNTNLTVYEETVEDAIHAVKFAKNDPRIDSEHVYIAGHSLGGMIAPRIDIQGGETAGLIILAGSPRNLIDIIYDQTNAAIENTIDDETEKEEQITQLEKEYQEALRLENISDQLAKDIQLFGLSGFYLKEMNEFYVPDLIEEIEKPFLILQGEADFQIFYEEDYQLWHDLLGERDNVSFISYPGLNHFFITSEGPYKGTVEEYMIPNQVDKKVINDIATWIRAQNK